MTFTTQHLLRRPSGLYFRLVVPKALRLALGKTEIRHPLKTSSEFVALQLSKRLWSHYQSVFESLSMSRFPIDPHVFGWIADEVRITKKEVVIKGAKTDGPEDAKNLQDTVLALQQGLLQESESFIDLSEARPSPKPNPKLMLSVIGSAYVQDRITKKISQDQINKHKTAVQTLIEIIGDQDINKVVTDDVNLVRETLLRIPTHRSVKPEFKNKNLAECIRIAEEKNATKLSTQTVDHLLLKLSGFFAWAIKRGHLKGANLFEDQTYLSKSEHQKNTEREEFSTEELQKIFSRDIYSKIENPFLFWGPLLSLLSGARLNEIAQLKVDDIRIHEAIPYLNLRKSGDKEDKQFKSITSERIIPLHRYLVDIGFITFVQDMANQGHKRLFPHLKLSSKGVHGTAASKQFQYHLREKIGIKGKGKVFHSFRKNFNDTLKQRDVDLASRCELMGHVFEHVNIDAYTNLSRLNLKKKWIEKSNYKNINLDKIRYVPHSFDNFRTAGGRISRTKGNP